MHVPPGGQPPRSRRARPRLGQRASSYRRPAAGGLQPMTPLTDGNAADAGPRSNRRVSFAAHAEKPNLQSDVLMTRPSADFLMSIDLQAPKNQSAFASRMPYLPQVATPTRLGAPRGNAKTFDALIRRAELRKGEGRLVDEHNYSYMISETLQETNNSQGVELTILDQLQPISSWAKAIKLDANGNIPEAVRREFNLMFKAGSELRPRAALKTDNMLYIMMPEMFGDGLKLYHMIQKLAEQNRGDYSVALPVLRHTMGSVLEELSSLHNKGIFHRDIKLDNLLFSDDGLTAFADFGLAHEGPDKGDIRSTYAYYAPSMFTAAKVDAAKTDVYALGATLMVLYSDHMPFFTHEANQWQLHSDDLLRAEADLEGYRQSQSHEAMRDESLEDKRSKKDASTAALVAALKAYTGAHRKMTDYIVKRNGGDIDAPLPDLGRPDWTDAFSKLVRRDFAVAPLIVSMLAPNQKERISARDALAQWRAESLGIRSEGGRGIASFYREYCGPTLQQAQGRANALIENMRDKLAAPSPLFDEPQLENQPIVANLDEAKQHIVNLATDVYHSIEAVQPGAVTTENLNQLAYAKRLVSDKGDIDAGALEEVRRQVREATPPKIEPVSNVRGVKRIRDISIKVR